MPLRDIVDVQIRRETAAVTRVGFGTLLFLYEVPTALDARVQEFASFEEVSEEFAEGTPPRDAASVAFSQELRPRRIKIGYKLESESWVEAIDACIDADPDWYMLCADTAAEADLLAIAANIEPRRNKFYLAKSADAGILDPNDDTDVASQMLDLSYARTGLIYHSQSADAYPDVAWAGGRLPFDPGSITWAFKQLTGIPTDSFTGQERTALDNKRVSYYQTVAGLGRTIHGYVFDSGAYIDIIRGIDWLEQRMSEDIFETLANTPKVPYTNAGIETIANIVRRRLEIAVDRDVIAPEPPFEVNVPDVLDVEFNNRANRLLRDVTFNARLAGAIQEIIIRGTVTV